uniref:Serine protease snake n=1 Tax=Cacopsylla melanoneura TaxID=428564 RepID=A0A8D8U4E2_9HEMI
MYCYCIIFNMLGLTFFLLGITFSNADTIEVVEIDLDKFLQQGLRHPQTPNRQQYYPQPARPFNPQTIQQHHHNPQQHNIQPSYPEPFGNIQKRSCNSFIRYRQPDYDDRPIWGSSGNAGEMSTRISPIEQRNTPPTRRSTRLNRQKCMEYCRPTNPTIHFPQRTVQSLTPATSSKTGSPIIFFGVQGGTDSKRNEFPHMNARIARTAPERKTIDPKLVEVFFVQGGVDSKKNEFPHMVAIGFRNVGSGITSWNNCGGTLISHWYIMTAAHCTDSELGSPALVRLGALNVNRNLPGQEVEDIGVAQVIAHPEYQGTRGDLSIYHDVALLRLERRVEFREGVQPACLYDEQEVNEREVVATGWGNLGFADAPSDVLQKVQLDIIPGQQCKDLLGTDATIPRGIQSQGQVCAGVLEGGRDTCSGDSGGPLQVNNTRTFRPGYSCGMEIIGITSFGKFCAEKNSPGVYTRVANYIPWIESVVWQNGD